MPEDSDHVFTYASAAHFDAPYGDSGAGIAVSAVGIAAPSPYSAPPVEVNTTDAPQRPAASTTLSVPRTLTAQSRPGSSTEATTLAWAARWKIARGCTSSTTASSAAKSTMSSVRSSAPSAPRRAAPEEGGASPGLGERGPSGPSPTGEPRKPAPPGTSAR